MATVRHQRHPPEENTRLLSVVAHILKRSATRFDKEVAEVSADSLMQI